MMQFHVREVEEPSHVSPNRSNKNISSHSVSKHCIQVVEDFFAIIGESAKYEGEKCTMKIFRGLSMNLFEFFETLKDFEIEK